MSRRKPMFYNALLLTGVNLLLRLVGTTFQVYLSGQIGAAGIGLLQLVLSVGGLALTAGMAGIRTATMYLTAEEYGKNRKQYLSHILTCCIRYSLLCSGAVAAGIYLFAQPIGELWLGNGATAPAVKTLACFLPVSCLVGVFTGYFTAAGKIKTLALVEVAEQVFSIIITLSLLSLWAGQSAPKACQAVVLGSGLSGCLTLLLLALLRRRESLPAQEKTPAGKRLLAIAAPLAVADDLKAGISTTENLMVPKRLALYPGESNPLAAFGTVCGMVFPVLMFPAAFLFGLCELLIPEMARCAAAGSQKRISYLTKRSLRVSMLYGFFFCGLLHLLAEPLCLWLYESPEAGSYLSFYAWLAPMLYGDAVTDAINKGLGQQKICVRFNILTNVLDVAFLFVLLPRFGMKGYAFSFLFTHLLNFLLSLWLLIKTAKVRLSLLRTILTALAAFGSVALCRMLSYPVLSACAFCLVFFSALVLLGIVSTEDAKWIKSLLYPKEKPALS